MKRFSWGQTVHGMGQMSLSSARVGSLLTRY
jgi:hypothetical protein